MKVLLIVLLITLINNVQSKFGFDGDVIKCLNQTVIAAKNVIGYLQQQELGVDSVVSETQLLQVISDIKPVLSNCKFHIAIPSNPEKCIQEGIHEFKNILHLFEKHDYASITKEFISTLQNIMRDCHSKKTNLKQSKVKINNYENIFSMFEKLDKLFMSGSYMGCSGQTIQQTQQIIGYMSQYKQPSISLTNSLEQLSQNAQQCSHQLSQNPQCQNDIQQISSQSMQLSTAIKLYDTNQMEYYFIQLNNYEQQAEQNCQI